MTNTNFLSKIAPWLTTAADGQITGLSMSAFKIIADSIGSDDLSMESLTEAIVIASPETLEKLQTAELNFADRVKLLGYTDLKAFEKATVKIATSEIKSRFTTNRSLVPAILAISVTIGFFGIMGLMLAGVWKPSDNQALLILLGSLGTAWGSIINFYFGSSAGSAQKDEMIAQRGPSK